MWSLRQIKNFFLRIWLNIRFIRKHQQCGYIFSDKRSEWDLIYDRIVWDNLNRQKWPERLQSYGNYVVYELKIPGTIHKYYDTYDTFRFTIVRSKNHFAEVYSVRGIKSYEHRPGFRSSLIKVRRSTCCLITKKFLEECRRVS